MANFFKFPDKILNLDTVVTLKIEGDSILMCDTNNDLHHYRFANRDYLESFLELIIIKEFNDISNGVFVTQVTDNE